MSQARPEDAPADCATARRLLEQAERHLASSRLDGVDAQSAYGMRYDAGRKACDAVMRAAGRRLTKGLGHHRAYMAEAGRLLGDEHASAVRQLERAARIRNGAEYDAREVTQSELEAVDACAEAVLAAAQAYVEDRC